MNTFGNKFRVSVFGESHGEYVGVTLDGIPAGLAVNLEDFTADIDRRRPSGSASTARREDDVPGIISGWYKGHSTGAPMTILFANRDCRSVDYSDFTSVPRPGHADFSAGKRFGGWNDPRGGGQFSGRLTLPLVAAGVIAKKMLAERGDVSLPQARIVEIGGVPYTGACNPVLEKAVAEGDSLGAVVECTARLASGFGEPFWDSVESLISHAVFAIPGVRGIEFGDGFKAAAMKGSVHNDPFGADGLPVKNGSGGVNGGITNGAPLLFRVAFKPTSSIAAVQRTFDFAGGRMTELKIKGRHDVCFALRTPAVVEAVTAIVMVNLLN